MRTRSIEVIVGLFIIVAMVAVLFLAFQVSGASFFSKKDYYEVSAEFDTVGGLKVRSPVKLGGVTIGRVEKIVLNPETLRAKVTLLISNEQQKLPSDSEASILTQGILGANYIGLTPGFETNAFLHQTSQITSTHSALILENLIGDLLFSMKGEKKK